MRFDVSYRDLDRRKRSHSFTDPGEAEAFKEVVDAGTLTLRRWPLAALLAPSGLSPRVFARRYGISYVSVERAEARGLTDKQADQWAVRAGYHPMNIWGWSWIDAGLALDEFDRLLAQLDQSSSQVLGSVASGAVA